MNKVDPCSTIDHSHKNTRSIYVSVKCHIKCNKFVRNLGNSKITMLLSDQGLEFEHGGNNLITGQ